MRRQNHELGLPSGGLDVPRQLRTNASECSATLILPLGLNLAPDGAGTRIGTRRRKVIGAHDGRLLDDGVRLAKRVNQPAFEEAWLVLVYEANNLNNDGRHGDWDARDSRLQYAFQCQPCHQRPKDVPCQDGMAGRLPRVA